jgi:serine/threonine-protein kinase
MATLAQGEMLTPTIRLERSLGAGGMGRVWLAEHLALRTRVVVKLLSEALAENRDAIARFSREATAASMVRSAHVVEIFDHGVTADGAPYIVMEHLEGEDLADHLHARHVLAPGRVAVIVRQVAHALARAHERGVVHRDIKPSNVFLCAPGADDPRVKVLDFGVAKQLAADATLTASGTALGTPAYMSPEQAVAARGIDARSDLFSLGVVAFEMLTGTLPFVADSLGGMAVALHTQALPRPSERNASLPPGVDAWFARSCARDASARFPDGLAMADALDSAVTPARGSTGAPLAAATSIASDVTASRKDPSTDSLPRGAKPEISLETPLAELPMATRIRTTWLVSSQLAVRKRGLFDAYLGLVAAADRAALTSVHPGGWVPIELAASHYDAIEGLKLSPLETVAMGREIAQSGITGSILASAIRVAASVGAVTPWTAVGIIPRIYARSYEGGGIRAWRLGDRDAILEMVQNRVCRYSYVRQAIRGMLQEMLEIAGFKTLVRLYVPLTSDTSLAYRVGWS